MKLLSLLVTLSLLSACSSSGKSEGSKSSTTAILLPQSIDDAVNSNYRSTDNKARDQYRHPSETLEFFGLQPNMTVVEIWPSAGWYTEILAPYLATKGHYIAAVSRSTSSENQGLNKKYAHWMKENPSIAATIKTTDFNPPSQVDIAPPGSADMVLTFRNLHNWMGKHGEKAAFKAFFKALKPGGVLGFEEHRASPISEDTSGKSGYVSEAYVIDLAKKAGFKLADKSDINANPKDTKNYPEGVWTLPPTLKLGDKDRDKYLAIGESDRMTLRFVKPRK